MSYFGIQTTRFNAHWISSQGIIDLLNGVAHFLPRLSPPRDLKTSSDNVLGIRFASPLGYHLHEMSKSCMTTAATKLLRSNSRCGYCTLARSGRWIIKRETEVDGGSTSANDVINSLIFFLVEDLEHHSINFTCILEIIS